MLIEDVLRGRRPLRIDGLSAHTGKPEGMIRAAVARGVAAGELAITPAGHIALLRCKPADTTAKTTETHQEREKPRPSGRGGCQAEWEAHLREALNRKRVNPRPSGRGRKARSPSGLLWAPTINQQP